MATSHIKMPCLITVFNCKHSSWRRVTIKDSKAVLIDFACREICWGIGWMGWNWGVDRKGEEGYQGEKPEGWRVNREGRGSRVDNFSCYLREGRGKVIMHWNRVDIVKIKGCGHLGRIMEKWKIG